MGDTIEVCMDVRRVASIWKIMVNPNDIDMKDISTTFSLIWCLALQG
jgi:hypothetical protein